LNIPPGSSRLIDSTSTGDEPTREMEAITAKLENKLQEWKPETSEKVQALVTEIIELADEDALDLGRSRSAEQEVLDALD
jgi:hypothetical protein